MSRSTAERALRGRDRTVLAVVAFAVVALLARLVLLGDRVAHYDEGRVAYWALDYLETGAIHYRYIVHGPFVQYVNRYVFGLLGANDYTMRLFLAVVGGLLPLAALLYRERLRDDETVALAAVLAFNPVLVYYSRFFRSTLLVAAFMFVALGLGLRALDRGRPRWLYAAGVFVALAFASKENAVVYVICWLGAGALLLDYALMVPADGESAGARDALQRRYARARAALADPARRAHVRRWAGHVAGALLLSFLVVLFFYAPRDPGPGVGLWDAVFDPTRVPALFEATWHDIENGLHYWFGGTADPGCHKDNLIEGYACFLGQFLQTLANYAVWVSVFAVVGFVADRYSEGRPRPLVMLAGYWGVVSVLGYPLGTDIYGGWITVNAIVPLAIPAAVGLALLGRWGLEAFDQGDQLDTVVVLALVLLVVGQVAWVTVSGVYIHDQRDENELVQYAQPAGDFRPVVKDLRAAAPDHEGLDVLFYGRELTNPEGEGGGITPECTVMIKTLPLQWYLRMTDATGDCAYDADALDRTLANETPVVVIAHADHRAELERRLDGYVVRTYRIRTTGRPVAFFVKAGYATHTNETAVTAAPDGDGTADAVQ